MSGRVLVDGALLPKISPYTVQIWFYITENFVIDAEAQKIKNEEMMRALDENIIKIVPIWVRRKEELQAKHSIPYGLAAIAGLNWEDSVQDYEQIRNMVRDKFYIQSLNEVRGKLRPPVKSYILLYHINDEAKAIEFMDRIKRLAPEHEGYLCSDRTILADMNNYKVKDIRKYGVSTWLYYTDISMHEKNIKRIVEKGDVMPIWTKDRREYSNVMYGLYSVTGLSVTDNDQKLLNNLHAMFRDKEELKQKKMDELWA